MLKPLDPLEKAAMLKPLDPLEKSAILKTLDWLKKAAMLKTLDWLEKAAILKTLYSEKAAILKTLDLANRLLGRSCINCSLMIPRNRAKIFANANFPLLPDLPACLPA